GDVAGLFGAVVAPVDGGVVGVGRQASLGVGEDGDVAAGEGVFQDVQGHAAGQQVLRQDLGGHDHVAEGVGAAGRGDAGAVPGFGDVDVGEERPGVVVQVAAAPHAEGAVGAEDRGRLGPGAVAPVERGGVVVGRVVDVVVLEVGHEEPVN